MRPAICKFVVFHEQRVGFRYSRGFYRGCFVFGIGIFCGFNQFAVTVDKVPQAGAGTVVKVFFPKLCHARQIAALYVFHSGGAIYQPGDGGGITQVGGEFGVGVLQEIPLARESAYLGGERWKIDEIFIPHLTVGTG
ncbi:hypothetical protein [Microbulbifer pacificus]|uniref:hypothetical protein n=1 Tax=Microbulbifer pacificus TaxID=407164 RepID=UPI000CF4F68A|nr:hypothetical protein [Microbulbifer pacificus]